jgi:hypothetical protein
MSELKVIRGSGATSCLMVRLSDWFEYWHREGTPPDTIDSSEQFSRYRDVDGEDVTKTIFNEYIKPENPKNLTDFHHEWQYKWYNEIPLAEIGEAFNIVNPFSQLIVNKAKEISDMIGERTVVLYRGNDKSYEIFRTPYFCMQDIAKEIKEHRFFVQTDEIEFYEFWKENFPDTIAHDKLPRIHKNPDTFYIAPKGERMEFLINFFASLLAISKAKKVIMTTGNIGLTVALLRGKSEGIWQFHGNHRLGRKL